MASHDNTQSSCTPAHLWTIIVLYTIVKMVSYARGFWYVKIWKRDREDDTYVLWDDDECDPLALLMVDRKTETLGDSYTPKRVSDFLYNSQRYLNNKWSLKRVCEDSVQTWHLSYIWNMCSTMCVCCCMIMIVNLYKKRFGFDRKKRN